jgi:carbonic anhydrase
VIRNAGGRASDDALRSLVISHELLGTQEFLVIHHTDCGMLTFTNGTPEKVREDLGRTPGFDSCRSRTWRTACGRTWSSCRRRSS